MTRPQQAHAGVAYWRRNLLYVGLLLVVWAAVSFGAGILFVEPLNRFRIPGTGFPLGFWFAQQGAIYVFVALIFVYVGLMNRLDREYGRQGVWKVDETPDAKPARAGENGTDTAHETGS